MVVNSKRFDASSFKENHSELYMRYLKEISTRVFRLNPSSFRNRKEEENENAFKAITTGVACHR
jgi:hypothetical protein